MPFDKHIIGQVPAVIRALFNVSELESELGASGAGSYLFSSALTPRNPPDRWEETRVGKDDPRAPAAILHS